MPPKKTKNNNYESLSVKQLKQICVNRRIPNSGFKKDLIERLKDDDNEKEEATQQPVQEEETVATQQPVQEKETVI
jgi:hypothetical protein